MINYFENDYSIPVILGNCADALKAAYLIRRKGKAEIHIFSEKISIFKRARYTFHKLPRTNRFILVSLFDFTNSIHEYFTPILVYCDSFSDFIEENKSALETRYIIIHAKEVEKHLTDKPEE